MALSWIIIGSWSLVAMCKLRERFGWISWVSGGVTRLWAKTGRNLIVIKS
jgi:hypothetical protein